LYCCVDVDYRSDHAVAACVGFEHWTDEAPCLERVVLSLAIPAPYEPGRFYVREMPYLIELLRELPTLPKVIVVDGFVWLAPGVAGLGAHVFEAFEQRAAVVGVAKSAFGATSPGELVFRGQSRRSLFVTAAGMPVDEAARGVAAMHGRFRIPTLLRRADRLARDYRAGGEE
jgi:deoxyribonuclease V